MTPSLFILSISFYLVSLVAALVGSFFVRHIPERLVNTGMIFHILVFIFWLVFRSDAETVANPGNSNFLFLSFFCSGILVAGMMIRKMYPVYMKIYFSLFLLSVLVFLVSPSRVLGFICSGNINAISAKRIHLKENYYFVEQQSVASPLNDSIQAFKVVREMGFFHKTLTRDVMLPATTDSANVLEFKENENIFVRIYFLRGNNTDTVDIQVPLKSTRDSSSIITKQKK